LNVTHGEITSTSARPSWAMPALRIGTSCCLSPENERDRNVAAIERASLEGFA
jgi:hypothetical protein